MGDPPFLGPGLDSVGWGGGGVNQWPGSFSIMAWKLMLQHARKVVDGVGARGDGWKLRSAVLSLGSCELDRGRETGEIALSCRMRGGNNPST